MKIPYLSPMDKAIQIVKQMEREVLAFMEKNNIPKDFSRQTAKEFNKKHAPKRKRKS